MNWFVYIVECSDSSLYTGISTDVERRLEEHNHSKKGAKALRNKLPVVLKYSEKYTSRSEALKRELEIKGWTREKKIDLISNE